MNKLLFIILLLFSFVNSILSLKCYISPIPYIFNESITKDNVPLFDNNNTLIDIGDGECTLTIMWLKNVPIKSIIIFGYNIISNKNKNKSLIDLILASVRYELDGEELLVDLSHDIQFQCQSIDECNNDKNIKKILNSIQINESFSDHFSNLIKSNSSFNNQSIKNCYFNINTTDSCLPIDYSNCKRCQITMDYKNSLENNICATCPKSIDNNFNFIKREKIFLLNNQTELIEKIHLSCQIGEHCNSIENIHLIRQFSFIHFDFDKYFF